MPSKTILPSRAHAKRSTPKVSRTHKPESMDVHDWQRALRRQHGQERAADLTIRNLGKEKIFSEFAVTSPDSGRTYRVAVRGASPGVNYCSCPDFAINTLGTCKHIEGVLLRLERRFGNELRQEYTPPFAEVYVRYGLRRTVVFSPGRGCPAGLQLAAGECFRKDGSLDPVAVDKVDGFLRRAAKFDHELRVYDDAAVLVAELRDDRARRASLQRKYRSEAAWKGLLKVALFPYQRTGALFAAQAGRALIADEMGLGKTIQAIAAAEILAREAGADRVLIICPSTLKSQWEHEISRFCCRSSCVLEGATHQRKAQYGSVDAFFKIVNYDVIHRDLDAIGAWGPELVILDEAQRIKNWQTRTAQAVKKITSRYAIVLTGTPLENRIEELHSITEFVDRFRLGPLFAFKATHELTEEGSTKVIGYRDLNRINRTLAPVMIRRTKKEVLDQLPPRMDKNIFVSMTPPQWVPHNENKETVARLVAKWRRYRFLTDADQLKLRIALQNMRMSCDSTYLVDHQTKHGTKVAELATLLEEIFESPEAKVVIFSQWVRMNELVMEMLEERRWGHVHLHGGVPSRQRSQLVSRLREDKHCQAFLSTDAGGVGLNLQTASTVINMDLPWNPAVLEQRIARVHRLGQKNAVRVVNFIAEDTIEHGMLSILSFKRSMFAGVIDGSTDKVMMGDSALNRFMKTIESATSATPSRPPTVPAPESEDSAAAPISAPAKPGDGGATTQLLRTASLNIEMLGGLFVQGASLLQTFGRALQTGGDPPGPGNEWVRNWVTNNSATGKPEIRIPLPDQGVLEELGKKLLHAIAGIPPT